MISSLLGAVVMSAATVAMLVAIQITNESLDKVGRHPLTIEERENLINAGFEVDLGVNWKKTADFGWKTNFIFTKID